MVNEFMRQPGIKIDPENSEIVFTVDTAIYSKEVVFKACYVFVDRVYIFFDQSDKGRLLVHLKSKSKSTAKKLEALQGEFLNELLNAIVRREIIKRNQTMVEHIVGGAINAALTRPAQPAEPQPSRDDEEEMQEIAREIEALKKELELEDEGQGGFNEDPMDIQKPV